MHYIMIFFLSAMYVIGARAENVLIDSNKSINIKLIRNTHNCFSIKNIIYSYKNEKINVNFDYADFDLEYERQHGDAIVAEFPCLCNSSKTPPFVTRAGYIVQPYVNANSAYFDKGTKPFYGKLDNVPDLEKYSKGRLPMNGNYDTLPKHDSISFPLMYINGKLAMQYHLIFSCG